jgi:hypothetical protein
MLSIPLEVWEWYGDEALSQSLRVCCSWFKIPPQTHSHYSAGGVEWMISGRYVCTCISWRTVITDIRTGATVTETPPGCEIRTRCAEVMNNNSLASNKVTVWSGTAANLRHFNRIFRYNRQFLPHTVVDIVCARAETVRAETAHARAPGPTFSAGRTILTVGSAFEHKYIIDDTLYSSTQKVDGDTPYDIWAVVTPPPRARRCTRYTHGCVCF